MLRRGSYAPGSTKVPGGGGASIAADARARRASKRLAATREARARGVDTR